MGEHVYSFGHTNLHGQHKNKTRYEIVHKKQI